MKQISFDQYCSAVRLAKVNFILTRREEAPWWLEFVAAPNLLLQFGADGGASVVEGTVTADSYVLLARHNPSPSNIAFNGEPVLHNEFVLLPPGAHFVISADGPRSWLSLTIPRQVVEIAWAKNAILQKRLQARQPCIVPVSTDQQLTLLSLAEFLLKVTKTRSDMPEVQRVENSLLETARHILCGDGIVQRVSLEYRRANDIVATALSSVAHLDHIDNVYVDDLAQAADVHSRTLLRAFHSVVGMGPVRYLRFRQLNVVRRMLNEAPATTVTASLQSAGVSDMGRFSGLYKELFGELPSETLLAAEARNHGRPRD
jgi:AraC family ethanolamine operon transcriptional activator